MKCALGVVSCGEVVQSSERLDYVNSGQQSSYYMYSLECRKLFVELVHRAQNRCIYESGTRHTQALPGQKKPLSTKSTSDHEASLGRQVVIVIGQAYSADLPSVGQRRSVAAQSGNRSRSLMYDVRASGKKRRVGLMCVSFLHLSQCWRFMIE